LQKVGLSLSLLLLFYLFWHSRFGYRYPGLREYSGISTDNYLNKTIINPFRSLIYAINDFNRLNQLGDTNPYLDDKTFKATFPQDKVTDILRKTAQGSTIEKPKQIFLIVMESYDSWPLMDKYQAFILPII